MAGGMYSKRGPGVPLGTRTGAEADVAAGQIAGHPEVSGDVAVTACWLAAQARLPASVLAWRRDPTAGWQALVAAWVPADHVQPRNPESARSRT